VTFVEKSSLHCVWVCSLVLYTARVSLHYTTQETNKGFVILPFFPQSQVLCTQINPPTSVLSLCPWPKALSDTGSHAPCLLHHYRSPFLYLWEG
jgi:hypothetical protein